MTPRRPGRLMTDSGVVPSSDREAAISAFLEPLRSRLDEEVFVHFPMHCRVEQAGWQTESAGSIVEHP